MKTNLKLLFYIKLRDEIQAANYIGLRDKFRMFFNQLYKMFGLVLCMCARVYCIFIRFLA